MKHNLRQKRLLTLLLLIAVVVLIFYLLQRVWAHRTDFFVPDYPRVTLTEQSDPETIFRQTGLGPSAAARLLEQGDFQTILDAQDNFFAPPKRVCTPLLGWFTREDRLAEGVFIPIDLQPGDILVTLSTHTAGWRHGHAALVIDKDTTLESILLGTDSCLVSTNRWYTYSGYAVLRVKGVTPELQQQVVQYSLEHLQGIPYRLCAGFLGPKAPESDAPQFGLHCSYLVWYAWNQFGHDLDSDGGRLVTSHDLLHSDQLEVVQICGIDPRLFLPQ